MKLFASISSTALASCLAIGAAALPAADLAPNTNPTFPASAVTGFSSLGSEGTIASPLLAAHSNPALGLVGIGPGPASLTITVVNSHGAAVTTSHAHGAGEPAASGAAGRGTIAAGATASFVAPRNWTGIVAVNDARYDVTDNDSLVEGSFKWVEKYGRWVVDLDISYVNGFSLALSCQCRGSGRTIGCAKNLWKISSCADTDGQGACVNPKRADNSANFAAPFFRPCEGLAWTFPQDGRANSFGECQSGHATCCVGTNC